MTSKDAMPEPSTTSQSGYVQAKKARYFVEMSEQDRIDALTSGICSPGTKALTLLSMDPNTTYTITKLASAFEGLTGNDLPFEIKGPKNYCENSLEPIGMVVEVNFISEHGSSTVKGYKVTEDASFGKYIAVLGIYAAHKTGISLYSMFGSANSSGEVRRGYAITKILEQLSDQKIHTEKELSDKSESNRSAIGSSLSKLHDAGLIIYESVRPQDGNLDIMLKINYPKLYEHLEKCKRNPVSYTEKINNCLGLEAGKYPKLGVVAFIKNLSLIKGMDPNNEIRRSSIDNRLGHSKSYIDHMVRIMIELEIASYVKFHQFKRSEARITEAGTMVYEMLVKPVLELAKQERPDSSLYKAKTDEFVMSHKSEIQPMINSEISRYRKEKAHYGYQGRKDKEGLILSCFESLRDKGIENIRQYQIRDATGLHEHSIDVILKALVKNGSVSKVGKSYSLSH